MDDSDHTTFLIDGESLSIDAIERFCRLGSKAKVRISETTLGRVAKARETIEKIAAGSDAVYGINTGFGRLANTRIPADKLEELQDNLIRSHACGVGEPLDQATVRLAMLLRINSLARGHSGVRVEVCERYADFLNRGIVPWVPSRGSVGASGDLAPLSHVALCLMGEGRCYWQGELVETPVALAAAGVTPIKLRAKEGLALINGTQFIQAIGLMGIIEARRLVKLADMAAGLSLEALRGTDRAFDARIGGLRSHPGHMATASNLRHLMVSSPIRSSHIENDPRVQDQYSLRCVPQVHGASRDALRHVETVFAREMNSVTDNPLIFPDTGEVISGGNFHGQPLALPLDYLAIAMAELASISERRIESMVNPDLSLLPSFLSEDAGLNSGMMIAQVTAAALVSENKGLCHPASVDSIPTSANQEDHVSMGVWGAIKLRQVCANVRQVIEVELLCARYGIGYLKGLTPGPNLNPAYQALCEAVPMLTSDRVTYRDFEAVRAIVDSGCFDRVLDRLA